MDGRQGCSRIRGKVVGELLRLYRTKSEQKLWDRQPFNPCRGSQNET